MLGFLIGIVVGSTVSVAILALIYASGGMDGGDEP